MAKKSADENYMFKVELEFSLRDLIMKSSAGVCKHVYFAQVQYQPLDLGKVDRLANPAAHTPYKHI